MWCVEPWTKLQTAVHQPIPGQMSSIEVRCRARIGAIQGSQFSPPLAHRRKKRITIEEGGCHCSTHSRSGGQQMSNRESSAAVSPNGTVKQIRGIKGREREREGRDALRGYLHKFVISTRRRASTVRDLDGSRNPRVSTTWRRVSGGQEFRPADLCSSSWALLCRAASGIARIISISSRANFASSHEERGKKVVRVKRFHF